jgi:hypothetical protein
MVTPKFKNPNAEQTFFLLGMLASPLPVTASFLPSKSVVISIIASAPTILCFAVVVFILLGDD